MTESDAERLWENLRRISQKWAERNQIVGRSPVDLAMAYVEARDGIRLTDEDRKAMDWAEEARWHAAVKAGDPEALAECDEAMRLAEAKRLVTSVQWPNGPLCYGCEAAHLSPDEEEAGLCVECKAWEDDGD